MDCLIYQQFFQETLNKFLSIDKDLIPWKKVCFCNLDFPHKMQIKFLRFYPDSLILGKTVVTIFDASKYQKIVSHKGDDNLDGTYVHPTIDGRIFRSTIFSKLTYLKLSVTNDHLTDANINCLTTLVYLDIGSYNKFTDDAILPLHSLESLFLGNNSRITSAIFPHLPNLRNLTLSNHTCISLGSVPDYVTFVFEEYYDKVEADDMFCSVVSIRRLRPATMIETTID